MHYGRWYYRCHLERLKEYGARYRAANREAYQESHRRWREVPANRERARLASVRYGRENKALLREKRRVYRANNRDLIRALNSAYRARKKFAPVNDLTAEQWREIKIAYAYRCVYCHRRRPLTMDHVHALSRGGSHTASNVVPACQPCNSRKNNRPAPAYQPLLM